MEAELVSIDLISEDPANVRRHPERNLDSIKASLTKFGQRRPIVVDTDGIVRAGNGTLAAARALGWTEIAVTWTDLRGSEATAYAIADNRTAELAEWNEPKLAAQLKDLETEGLLAAVSFDPLELAMIQRLADEVAGIRPPAPPKTLICPKCGHEFTP